jgi:hypothetical protein
MSIMHHCLSRLSHGMTFLIGVVNLKFRYFFKVVMPLLLGEEVCLPDILL